MKAKEIFSNTYLKAGLFVLAGLFLGWLIFHNSGTTIKTNEAEVHEHSEAEHQIWTCAMHPQIRMDEPGDCPICGMELIPLKSSSAEIDDQAIEMSESAMKLAEVQTSVVSKGSTSKDILLYGKIQVNERLLQSQTAHVPGRIEKLLINVTGEQVRKGQLIAKIYSPELVTAQKELIEALSLKDKYPAMVEATREKLRNWKLSDEQIGEIEKSGKVTTTVDIYANTSGIVSSRKVNEGDYISKGAVLFDVVDLTKVWGVFDAYESDLAWISMNQAVDFTAQSIPGKTYSGKISFIDPVVDPNTRIVKVRIELGNPGLALKPEMFINGTIHSTLKGSGEQLTIPQTAVLWTGTRSVVYVRIPETEHPSFKMREITLGAAMKDTYVVLDGLAEGEEIVTNGTFSIDAAAQLAGKPSMMNSAGGKKMTSMPGMVMPGDPKSGDDKSMPGMDMSDKDVPMKTDPEFKAQLTQVYSAYLKMKNAFVATDAKKVSATAKEVEKSIQAVNMKLLKGDAHMAWMEQMDVLVKSIASINQSSDIEKQRIDFATFNLALYKSIKAFGLKDSTTYYQYCPMANGEKGAYWFSEKKEIKNPYFGEAMLGCGETRETLK
jgi:Cu(I)/Ag(I) efflux system membrane fusion protein